MTPAPDFQKYHHRDIETILLKTLIWKNPLSSEIFKILSPLDFSPQNRKILSALLNMIDFGIDIKKKTLEDALEARLNLPLFDHPPNDSDVIACLELIRQKSTQRMRALKQISEWEKAIDVLTNMVESDEIEPRTWVEKIISVLPGKRERAALIDKGITKKQVGDLKNKIDLFTGKVKNKEMEPHIWIESVVSLFPPSEEKAPYIDARPTKDLVKSEPDAKKKIDSVKTQGNEDLKEGTHVDARPTGDLEKSHTGTKPTVSPTQQIAGEINPHEALAQTATPSVEPKIIPPANIVVEKKPKAAPPSQVAQETKLKAAPAPQGREEKEGEATPDSKELLADRKHSKAALSEAENEEMRPRENEDIPPGKAIPIVSKDTIGDIEPDWTEIIKDFDKGEGRKLQGLRTGMEELDEKSLGLKGLNIIAGMPKMGKTTFALQLATEIARLNDVLSIYYSLEMDKKTLLYRILSRISHIPYTQLVLGRWSNLKEKERENYQRAREYFDTYKNNILLIDRTSTDIDTEQIYYQIDGFLKRAKKVKAFIVIDSLPSFCLLDREQERVAGGIHQVARILVKFRFIQQFFGATILLVYPKNFRAPNIDNPDTNEECYELIYPVDSFFEMHPKTDAGKSPDYYSELITDDEEIDLWAICRDTGKWFVPLTFSKPIYAFTSRKKGFKATRISWESEDVAEISRKSPQKPTAFLKETEAPPEKNKKSEQSENGEKT